MKTPTIPNHTPFASAQPATRGRLRRIGLPAALTVAGALAFGPAGALAQSDNFDDGNDNGWTRYDPIGSHPLLPDIATFTLTNGTYRIQTAPSPAPSEVGPGRAGSLRMDVTYTDFYLTVDVVAWDPTVNQSFGLLARVREVGLAQTDGYALTTAGDGDEIDITRFVNEDPSGGEVSVTGDDQVTFIPGRTYRFVFIGKGPQLTGRVYELPDLTTPVADITGVDYAYADGYCGLIVYDNSGQNLPTDTTFDNYLALPEEPPKLSVQFTPEIGELRVSWPLTFTGFILESTTVLPATESDWVEEPDVWVDGSNWMHGELVLDGAKFFRLRKGPPALRR